MKKSINVFKKKNSYWPTLLNGSVYIVWDYKMSHLHHAVIGSKEQKTPPGLPLML